MLRDVRLGHFEITTGGAISAPLVILLQLIDTGAEFTAGRGRTGAVGGQIRNILLFTAIQDASFPKIKCQQS